MVIRLCPPASTFASSVFESKARASFRDEGAKYSNFRGRKFVSHEDWEMVFKDYW
jgi:hypothetical protein